MARPFKQGLQYFPLDVNIFEDEKIQDLNLAFGYFGEIIYIRLLAMIYANGYFLEKSISSLAKTLVKSIGANWAPNPVDIEEVIVYCGKVGLFNNDLLKDDVITSKSIQKQFILSTRRRKNTGADKYWLLDEKTMLELSIFNKTNKSITVDNNLINVDTNGVNVNNNQVNADNNRVNVDKSTQKEKEKKKERKNDKEDKEDKGPYGLPKLHFITNSLIKNKYIDETSLDVIKYNILFEETIRGYGFEDVLSAVDYVVKYSKNPNPHIEDKFAFMRDSLQNNLKQFEHRRKMSNESFESWIKRTLLQVD
jgi:hypothetical protein